jgi:ribosome recycling factor
MDGEVLASADERMAVTVRALARDLDRIRVGGASASLIDDIHVDHHGRRMRLLDVASVTVPDPRQIVILPWDPASLRAIGTAISQSRIGLAPTIDGPALRVYVPALTEERRRELVEVIRKRVERARVEIRVIRHESLAAIRAAARGRDEADRDAAGLQHITDRFVDEIDGLGRRKEERALGLR